MKETAYQTITKGPKGEKKRKLIFATDQEQIMLMIDGKPIFGNEDLAFWVYDRLQEYFHERVIAKYPDIMSGLGRRYNWL